MFTGIIEEIGSVKKITKKKDSILLEINYKVLKNLNIGSSISINGVCLTVIEFNKTSFMVEGTRETLKISNLSNLKIGDKVNLEGPVLINGRFDGHLVMGHVDGIGVIRKVKKVKEGGLLTIKISEKLSKYVVNKGSMTVDGVSLTVSEISGDSFTVNIIPYTFIQTNIQDRRAGDKVNIEVDIIGKYIEKILSLKKGITKEFLDEKGYI
ncbi:MAG: riboflavin synthase [Candidatus Firestonebacteria bacterium]